MVHPLVHGELGPWAGTELVSGALVFKCRNYVSFLLEHLWKQGLDAVMYICIMLTVLFLITVSLW